MVICSPVPVQRRTVRVKPACALSARPYWKFRRRELQLVTGRFLSMDHEYRTVYLLLFATLRLVIFALRETAESVSIRLTTTAPVALNWSLAPLNERK